MTQQISTAKGTAVIVAMLGGVVLYATSPWERFRARPPPPSPTALTVIDVGFVVTHGNTRCQLVVFDEWCSDVPKPLPGMTRSKQLRSRVRVDKCAAREKARARKKKESLASDLLCQAKYKDVFDDRCRAESKRWVDGASSEREIRGRALEPLQSPAPLPECGSAACPDCTWPLPPVAAKVAWLRAPDGGEWRCPVDDAAWDALGTGDAVERTTAGCARAPPAAQAAR